MHPLRGGRMKIHIPNDEDAEDIRKKVVKHDLGIGLRMWLKREMDIDVDDALLESLMKYIEACKLARIETIDLKQAIDSHIKWQEGST